MEAICAHCGKKFVKNNGSSRYCPGRVCYLEAKRARQKTVDDLLKSFRKGIYHNMKLFKGCLLSKGSISTSLAALLYKGFDQNAYYGTMVDNENRIWHCVGQYMFSITSGSPQQILICKK